MSFRSDAEKQRQEWLSRQYAADCASTPGVVETTLDGEFEVRVRKLAAARESVANAAMAWWDIRRTSDGYLNRSGPYCTELTEACSALDKLERFKT